MADGSKRSSFFALRLRSIGGQYDPLSNPQRPMFSLTGNVWVPAADVADCDEYVTIRMEIPGIDPEELLVLQDGRFLVVQGHRTRQVEEGETCLHLMEIQYGSFERAFELPDYLDLNEIAATYKSGFLTIRIRKSVVPPSESRVKKVRIQEIL